MRKSAAAVHALVDAIDPADELEAQQRAETLRWLAGTDDVFRRIKPAVPDRHLVAYVVPVDPDDGSVLLVDHIKAGLWLPPGGHVEPDEHPCATAHREGYEELGLRWNTDEVAPVFLTVTRTVNSENSHIDVSIWFLMQTNRAAPVVADRTEFRSVRWWTLTEISRAEPDRFDPHLRRFLAKIHSRMAA